MVLGSTYDAFGWFAKLAHGIIFGLSLLIPVGSTQARTSLRTPLRVEKTQIIDVLRTTFTKKKIAGR